MGMSKRFTVGLAGGAIALAAAVGTAGAASAATDVDPAQPPAACTGLGAGRMGGWAGETPGAAYARGSAALAEYLAQELDVAVEDVSDALTAFHAANPVTAPGRDLADADRDAHHAALAQSLADALDVDAADAAAALDAYSAERQTERTAALQDALDARVADGTLTQAEADEILAAHEAGDRVGMGGMGGMRGHGGGRAMADVPTDA